MKMGDKRINLEKRQLLPTELKDVAKNIGLDLTKIYNYNGEEVYIGTTTIQLNETNNVSTANIQLYTKSKTPNNIKCVDL